MKRLTAVLLPFGAAIAMAAPSVAQAQPAPAGPAFGQHVSQCARTMGFDVNRNPGMHHGLSGWDGMPC